MPIDRSIFNNPEIADDTEISFGGQKFTAADFRSFLNSQDEALNAERSRIASLTAERDGYRTKHDELANTQRALLEAAQQQVNADRTSAANPPRSSRPDIDPDSPLAQYLNDPVLGDYTRRLLENGVPEVVARKVLQPLIDKELKPAFDGIGAGLKQLGQMQAVLQAQNDYRDAGEWPKDEKGTTMSLAEAAKYGRDNRIFLPGTDTVDIKRVHHEVTAPMREAAMREQFRKEERAAVEKEMREQYGVDAAMLTAPNRTVSRKPVKAKGNGAEEVMNNAFIDMQHDPDFARIWSNGRA